MKKYAILLVSFLMSFVLVDAWSGTLTVVDHTGSTLTIEHSQGSHFVHFKGIHSVADEASQRYYDTFDKSNGEEYISIAIAQGSSHILFGVMSDGVRGYVSAVGYSYRWTASADHPVITVCHTQRFSQCH